MTLGGHYFDELYARSDDPWNFRSSDYEREKYAATIEALGGERFGRALEIGCSIGVFTEMLASRCATLLAIDISERALVAARQRCHGLSNVRFDRMAVPAQFPQGSFDLVVLAEVGYYLGDDDLTATRELIAGSARTVELVHYLPKVPDYVRDGDAVHDFFVSDPRFERLRAVREAEYRIDVLRVRA